MSQAEHRTRLVLDLRDADLGSTDVAELVAAGNVACAILPAPKASVLNPVVEALQSAGVAALVANDLHAAKAAGADGVHLTAGADLTTRYATARSELSSDSIVGADAVVERHDLMVLAEGGVDYIAFSVPDRRDELLWWAEIFEVPCIALGDVSVDDAATFASKGVEFVSSPPQTTTVRSLETAVADVSWPKV